MGEHELEFIKEHPDEPQRWALEQQLAELKCWVLAANCVTLLTLSSYPLCY